MPAPTISDIGEFGFLSAIIAQAGRDRDVVVGPGQDCAVIRCGNARFLFTVDALVAGVHFQPAWLSPRQIGRKSFLVNASDVAAMGGAPRFCVISLTAPPTYAAADLHAVQRGIVAAARAWGAAVVGGNLSRANQLSVSIALVAHAPRRLVTRQGAKAGDELYVTGTLGDAALAVQRLNAGTGRSVPAPLLRRFREPSPRVHAGQKLVAAGVVTAMIDISDGLAQDLGHICEQSGRGAEVELSRLPYSAAFRRAAGADHQLALTGGEDYELLCTVPTRKRQQVERLSRSFDCPLTRIGRITETRTIRFLTADGRPVRIERGGHDHFRIPTRR